MEKMLLTRREVADRLESDPVDIARVIVLGKLATVDHPQGERIAASELERYVSRGLPELRSVARTFQALLTADEWGAAESVALALLNGDESLLQARYTGMRFATGRELLMAAEIVRGMQRVLAAEISKETHTNAMASVARLYESSKRLKRVVGKSIINLHAKYSWINNSEAADVAFTIV